MKISADFTASERMARLSAAAPPLGALAGPFWSWYDRNVDVELFSVGILFWRRRFTVADLMPIWTRIFGPQHSAPIVRR